MPGLARARYLAAIAGVGQSSEPIARAGASAQSTSDALPP
eukprot:CAMPEP_0179919038 /NCGR_PEP_ID=MMETSP0983-20121128/3702_1 /TAXON_ID=483367 /ORGANISM="non described non described, Strain CCMP 2436" /LENGTH=39 /DNA_ID= /DNA_START= /DNA_END= /DNA_ORIENTATION=